MTVSTLDADTAVAFSPRGPLSSAALGVLTGRGDDAATLPDLAATAVAASDDVVRDDDIQLALFVLYASSYGSLPQLDASLEWDAGVVTARRILEDAFEAALRDNMPVPELPEPTVDAVGRALFALAAADTGPSLSRHIARKATREQAEESLILRSVYTLREADPHSWAIPRLTGRPKAALVEIQSDEYGGGRPQRVHAELYARALRAAGLDDTYGAYVDDAPAITLASHNMMSLFGLNRRLVGAIVGHLAAYEMTSSIPCRFYADGLHRLGFADEVAAYFEEHVEADAVHEQIAARDLAGSLAEDRPELLADILFGAAACLTVDGWAGAHTLDAWTEGRSALRERTTA
ncbi:iron-containing redox enzyme family protein [Microbacterium sp. HSID17254]|uniref:iron-containing redox enzyme family protein n=1 Tax=Microbacterium sp. HSID17254 TaxID=2419509 RepID=UPI000F891DB4|nr:iron-containing redox enzyme family protein [Microbacterium sp. HSID17254]RUQ05891.1 iron-containing redox enzyme family protein [Microbacterium sp. HSID17254]